MLGNQGKPFWGSFEKDTTYITFNLKHEMEAGELYADTLSVSPHFKEHGIDDKSVQSYLKKQGKDNILA
ncbi:MAG TPA: hypothetical protein VK102_05900 [Sphingobacterium sp.]|nr:hypothetical protein [Sphingobacterium sp.]